MTPPVEAKGPQPLGSGAMFDRIAARYDLLNRVLSLGSDQRWRRLTVEALALTPGQRILDLATGTGDLALQIARAADVTVVGLDPSPGMLAIAEEKVASAKLSGRIRLTLGDAQSLPFEDGSFDGAAVAFGIRNVPDRPLGLRELARVVRPGGRIAILELTEPAPGFFGAFGRLYVHRVVPRVGALLSGAQEYRYLQDSIARFPPPAQFAKVMAENDIEDVVVRSFTLGACSLFVGKAAGSAAQKASETARGTARAAARPVA